MNARFLSVLFLLGATATGGLGCKTEAEKLELKLAPLRAAAEARVAALQKLAPTIKASPALTADTLQLAPGVVKFAESTSYDNPTAGLIYEANLDDVHAPHNLDPHPMKGAGLFGDCGAMLEGTGFITGERQETVLKNCAAARYVVMVRTLERVKPEVNEEDRTFTPGLHRGEVHVYDLDTGTDLGGFGFNEKTDDHIKSAGVSALADIETNLSISVEVFIEKRLQNPAVAAQPVAPVSK